MKQKRICIIGPGGAGKTTIATEVSKRLNIPHIEMDKIVWRIEEGQYVKNHKDFSKELTNNIVKEKEWVVEGADVSRLKDVFIASDIVIILDPGYIVRTYRVILRYLKSKKRKLGPNETILNTLGIILYNQRFLKQLQIKLNRDQDLSRKTISCKSSKAILKAVNSLLQ